MRTYWISITGPLAALPPVRLVDERHLMLTLEIALISVGLLCPNQPLEFLRFLATVSQERTPDSQSRVPVWQIRCPTAKLSNKILRETVMICRINPASLRDVSLTDTCLLCQENGCLPGRQSPPTIFPPKDHVLILGEGSGAQPVNQGTCLG